MRGSVDMSLADWNAVQSDGGMTLYAGFTENG